MGSLELRHRPHEGAVWTTLWRAQGSAGDGWRRARVTPASPLLQASGSLLRFVGIVGRRALHIYIYIYIHAYTYSILLSLTLNR